MCSSLMGIIVRTRLQQAAFPKVLRTIVQNSSSSLTRQSIASHVMRLCRSRFKGDKCTAVRV